MNLLFLFQHLLRSPTSVDRDKGLDAYIHLIEKDIDERLTDNQWVHLLMQRTPDLIHHLMYLAK